RELVDRQPGADPEQAAADLDVGMVVVERERDRPRDQHRADPEHEVVEVEPRVADDASRPPLEARAAHDSRAEADERERGDEPAQEEEQRLAIVGGDLVVPIVGDERGKREHPESVSIPVMAPGERSGTISSRARWVTLAAMTISSSMI